MVAEKDMEDAIALDPERYLGEDGLQLVERQYRIGDYIFDLLLEDRHGAKVIVEIQKGTLDRSHTYKILDYCDGFRERHPDEFIELMVVANRIPDERKKRLRAWGVEFREIPETEFTSNSHADIAIIPPAPTAQHVKSVTRSIVDVLPPEGKGTDLSACHPTREECEPQIATAGDRTDDDSILPDRAPLALVKSWLQQTQMKDGIQLLRRVHGDYYRWEGTTYRKMDQEEIRGEWYSFFTDRQVKIKTGDGAKITTLHPDRKFMADLHDAASAYCSVRIGDGVHEPFLIEACAPMDLARAVVFQNGILYLTDDRLVPLTPDVFLTSTLPYEYNPKRQCELWEWFVSDLFNGDQECVSLLQEWFGYNLIASNHMQSMMFFFGVPGSGKSTSAGVLQALLGGARCCGASTDNFKNLFGRESLLNKYAAIMSESRDTNHSEIDKLLQTWKAITGGDTMNIARKYKGVVDARLFCRLTYVANGAIPFDDVSQAMANRMNLLCFPNNYRKKNPDRMLEHKLTQELPGIALWSIEGLKRLLANDKFTNPIASQVHTAQLAQLTNPVGLMLEECTQSYTGTEFMQHRVECNVLYDLWKAWCDETRTKTNLSAIGFGMKLSHMEHPLVRRQIQEAGERKYVYQGLSIRPESMERYLKR